MAVGKDRFRPDAEAVMQALMQMQAACGDDDEGGENEADRTQ